MQTLIALLALAAIILLFAGLIRPRWAFLRARWQVLIAYSAALTVVGVLARAVLPPVDGADATAQDPAAVMDVAQAEARAETPAPAATATEEASPEWTPEVRARWCVVLERKRAISQALTEEGIGANPNEALRPGDSITLQEKSVINPAPVREDRTMDEMLDEIVALVQVPPGSTLEILDRQTDTSTGLMYVARWVERGITGRVDPNTLHWLNTMEAMGHAVDAREAAFKQRWHLVLIEAFGSVEAANTVEALAYEHGIYATCD